jgi:antitoxin (DNA-binding transcriptional repressor) of toxin-antitoxin stability system
VQAGDTIAITRRGKTVACLVTANRPRKRIDKAMLEAFTATLPAQQVDASELVRSMCDSDRA